jgi:hypothetical protein
MVDIVAVERRHENLYFRKNTIEDRRCEAEPVEI